MLKLPPLSLYVHIPWCVQKCPYCDFNSHAQKGDIPEQDYIHHLLQDLRADLQRFKYSIQQRKLHSIFYWWRYAKFVLGRKHCVSLKRNKKAD